VRGSRPRGGTDDDGPNASRLSRSRRHPGEPDGRFAPDFFPGHPEATYIPHTLPEQRFDAGEVETHYAVAGRDDQPALLLVPGQSESWWGTNPRCLSWPNGSRPSPSICAASGAPRERQAATRSTTWVTILSVSSTSSSGASPTSVGLRALLETSGKRQTKGEYPGLAAGPRRLSKWVMPHLPYLPST